MITRIYDGDQWRQGILMPDATLVPSEEDNVSVCFEIKPKFGCLQQCRTVKPSHKLLKHTNSRFQLHQNLKLKEDFVSSKSAYDPIDFFSGNPVRVQSALMSLLRNPQNNLIAFVNGVRQNLRNDGVDWENVVGRLFTSLDNMEVDSELLIASMLTSILSQEPVLDRILNIQMKSPYDVQAVNAVLESLVDEAPGSPVPIESKGLPMEDQDHIKAMQDLLYSDMEAKLDILRDYCLAATAKDCSIMVAITESCCSTPRRQSHEWCSEGCLLVESLGRGIRYRVVVVDLDRKTLAKVPKHAALDRRIMAANLNQIF